MYGQGILCGISIPHMMSKYCIHTLNLKDVCLLLTRENLGAPRFTNWKAFLKHQLPAWSSEYQVAKKKSTKEWKNANTKELSAFVPANPDTFPDLNEFQEKFSKWLSQSVEFIITLIYACLMLK